MMMAFLLRKLCPSEEAKSRKMAEADIQSVIKKLKKYPDALRDSHPEMETVIKEMREILAILRHKKLGGGRRLNFFVSDLDDMADDALYIYARRKDSHNWHAEMRPIHSWMGVIKMHVLELGVYYGAETTELSNMRSSKNDEHVVGLDEDVKMLLRRFIFNRKGRPCSFLIKGISGIGKTTLARVLYNHIDVIKRFECRAWVRVSTDLTIKELLIELIQQIGAVDGKNIHTSSLLEEMDNRNLQSMLHQHLQGKLYLIVLDDLPKQIHLTTLTHALPTKIDGSRVLVTSHTSKLNIHVRDVHHMRPLDSNASWQLFFKTINRGNKLTGDHKFPVSLEHKGKEMLRKCAGLPLAIKEVGKQLVEKKVSGGSEWEQLLDSVDLSSTLELLDLFYQKLDPKLESRFLYLAFYKENTTLRKEKLVHIWDAGGADSKDTTLDDLIDDSVLDVMYKSTEYRMNALLHMLFVQKAEEKLGLEILRSNGNNRPSRSPLHRVIICSRDKFNYSTNQDKHLVSLFFHGGGYFDASPSYWKSFEKLKILDLEDFGLKILPDTISPLMELRYLGLRNNYLQELPHSLGCLKDLEVLDIAQNFLVQVPDITWEMESLRHLYMSDVIFLKPLKIDAIKSLETLTYVSVDNWIYELSGLKMSTRLNKLGIEELDGDSDVSKLFVSLADSWGLEYLILRGYRFRSMPCLDELGILQSLRTLRLDGLLARLPNNLPPTIEYLKLINSCLDEDPMPLLEKLPKLKYLKLRNAYTGQEMVILSDGFFWLITLCIEDLWNLRNVQVAKGGMYCLKKLEIHNCPYLDTLPEAVVVKSRFKELKMVTTKKIATKIWNSDCVSKIKSLSINHKSSYE